MSQVFSAGLNSQKIGGARVESERDGSALSMINQLNTFVICE